MNYNNLITKLIIDKNIYSIKKIKSVYPSYISFEPQKNVINKFITDVKDDKASALKYLYRCNDVSFINKVKQMKNYKYLNLEKFNITYTNPNEKKVSMIFINENNEKIVAYINLLYLPDIYSKYKITKFEFLDKVLIAKAYKLWYTKG